MNLKKKGGGCKKKGGSLWVGWLVGWLVGQRACRVQFGLRVKKKKEELEGGAREDNWSEDAEVRIRGWR